jgi:hypothetical protein
VARRVLFPKLTDVLFVAVFVASVMLGPRMLNTDGDLGRHLTLGDLILTTHSVPVTNVLSWTKAGEPRPPYEWLAQVLLAAANRLLGLDGVVVITSFVIAAAFAVVGCDALQRSGMPLTSLLISAGAAVASSLHWLARPHIFSFLFLALWLGGLERIRRTTNARLWALPLLMLVWANTHGGFVFGFAAWIAYFGGWLWESRGDRADRGAGTKLLVTGAASIAASLVTPDLWHNWEAILGNRSGYILSQTAETMPPQMAMPAVWPFLILLGVAVVLAVLNARRVQASHLLLLAVLAAASLAMARNIPLFAIAAAPILSRWLSQILESRVAWPRLEDALARVESSLAGFAWPSISVLVVTGVLVFHWSATGSSTFRFRPEVFPVRAADWIEAHHPAGLMFNDFNWGGYLLYRLWPGERVYIDSQSDFYGEQLVRQYASLLSASPGWENQLSQDNVDWAVIPPAAPLAAQLRQNAGWLTAYEDSTAVVLVRRLP